MFLFRMEKKDTKTKNCKMYKQYGEGARGMPAHRCSSYARRWHQMKPTDGRFKPSRRRYFTHCLLRFWNTVPQAVVGTKGQQLSNTVRDTGLGWADCWGDLVQQFLCPCRT